MQLLEVAQAWGTEKFNEALKAAIETMDEKTLQLQKGLERSSVASDENVKAVILSCSERDGVIEAKVGVFYSGLIAGCACDDDPTPLEAIPEYCDLSVRISKDDGATEVCLWQEGQ